MHSSKNVPFGSQVSNSGFLKSLVIALSTLTISALILVAVFLIFQAEPSTTPTKTIFIPGSDLTTIVGKTNQTETTLELLELSQDHRAILSKQIDFNADEFPFVSFQITNRHPGASVYLIWRSVDDPQQIIYAPLYWSGDKETYIHMASNEDWHGEITELGLFVFGDMRGQTLTIGGLKLAPYSRTALLSTIWSEWTAYHGWDQTSINFLWGTPANPIVPPTVAIGAWLGISLLLMGFSYIFTKRTKPLSLVIIILIPWITTDLIWQNELSTQLTETKYLFAGQTQYERHVRDIDSDLFLYAQHLKEVLPNPGVKIYLLHDSKQHNYIRLKTQFHLLPHNIYSYGRKLPRNKHVLAGEYILVFGELPGLKFEAEKSELQWNIEYQWNKDRRLEVTVIDQHPMGTLYQVATMKDAKNR